MRSRFLLLPALLGLLVAACQSPPPPASNDAPASSGAKASASAASAPTAAEPIDPKAIPAPPDVAAPPADAVKTPSGLASKVIKPGTGTDHPGPEDKVKVHYTGWTKAGKMFDSSVARGEPIDFRLNQVIKGWTEGVQLMVVGEKRRLWIPGAMAYGDKPRMGAPGGDLVFDVELLEFKASPKPPPVPEDVKEAPKTATKTKSGLAYRVIKKGTGKDSPKAADKVTVNYSGWTTDGKMFDSSVTRGEPASFQLDGVIKGWTEGVQLMKQGDVVRFWIPADLAYGDKPGRPGTPTGMLVFDIELLDIKAAPKPPAVPEDVKAPPATATKTKSGLAYRVIKKGTGTTSPTAANTVTVNYSGWTTDGKMFDSSVTRGEPASFPLGNVIKGWTEGVQLMKQGDVVRFWIPADLAYGDKPTRPGAPSGMLVFDIELISIK